MLNKNQIDAFNQEGSVCIRDFIPANTAKALKRLAAADAVMRQNSQSVLDSAGRESKLTLWYTPGEDVFGRLSRSDRLHETMATLLGGPVSFFHAKLMNKEPKVGGKWEWHQDFGYWYNDGFLRSDMGSCFIALDPCGSENGALTVCPGSHQYGRLDHNAVGQQAGAEPQKTETILERHGTVLCEMQPGDALFFHSNTLHASGPNLSPDSRLILISSFFRRDNESVSGDYRFKNKDIVLVDHETILDGPGAMEADLSFSKSGAHIIS